MENVLEVYQKPHDPACPMVCLDETSKQLIKEMRVPIAAKPGQAARVDYNYECNGTANLFVETPSMRVMKVPLPLLLKRRAQEYFTSSAVRGCPRRL